MNNDTLNNRDQWKEVSAYVEKKWAYDAVEFHFRVTYPDHSHAFMTDVILEKETDEFVYTPGIFLKNEVVQHIMNQLWAIGFRPSDGVASIGQAEAMKNHIALLEKEIDKLHNIIDKLLEDSK